MKKLTKILTIIVLLLIVTANIYISNALTELGGTPTETNLSTNMPQINLSGKIKYIGIAVSLVIIVIIMYLSYKSDKKAENNVEEINDNSDDYLYEEASVSEGDSFLDETDNILSDGMENSVEYEEESLYNSANNYIENTEEYSNLDEEYDNTIVNEYEIEDNSIGENFDGTEDEFSYETKQEENYEVPTDNEEKEEIFFEENSQDIENETKEDLIEESFENEVEEEFSFDTNDNIEESSIIPIIDINKEENSFNAETKENEENNTIEKKRFTRKKQVIEQEVDKLDFEDDFEDDEEDDDVPTFDELLKKSEEEVQENPEIFDFMAEMEQNLKKEQAERIEKKKGKRGTSKSKESVAPKTTTKKKKSNEE